MTHGRAGNIGHIRNRRRWAQGTISGFVSRGGGGGFQPYQPNRGAPQNRPQQGLHGPQYPGDQHPFQQPRPLPGPPGPPQYGGQVGPLLGSGGSGTYGVTPLQPRPDLIGTVPHQGDGYPLGSFPVAGPTLASIFTVPVGVSHQPPATGVFVASANGSARPQIVQAGAPHNSGGPSQPISHFAPQSSYSPPRANGVPCGDPGGGNWQAPVAGIPGVSPGLQVHTLPNAHTSRVRCKGGCVEQSGR